MNYLAEIKAFYDALELNPQPNTAIALWHALMSIANKAGWPDTFTVASSVLGLRSGLNASALKRARNKLATDGFIEWRQRGGNQSAQYRMISLVVQNTPKNEPQFAPQNAPQGEPQFEPQCAPQSEPINKLRLKQKQDMIPPISPLERFEEFLGAYPIPTDNIFPAQKEYCKVLVQDCHLTEQDLVDAARHYSEAMRILDRHERYIKHPENFLKDNFFVDYLDGHYKRPEAKRAHNANKGMERSDYGDMSELEKELLANG